ncbi:MAG: GNAT family N-acetyltransferase [Candidatus Heimdallarchaeaceae archaeon]
MMKWNHEEEFENVAVFLGNLFDKTPKDIKERFLNIPETYVLALKEETEIKGVLISIRDEKAYNIMDLLYAAFEPDFNFKEGNVFNKLMNFCKKEYIDVIFAHTINENSFVNIDVEKLTNLIVIHMRVGMNLSLSDYKEKWYDEEKNELPKISTDNLEFNKKFKVSRKKKSKKFTFVGLNEVSWTKVAELQNRVYSDIDFEDNINILSKNSLDFNISLITRLFSGYYGSLSEEASYFALTDEGELAGYIITLAPIDRRSFIIDFAVDPSYQSFGLGKALFRNAIIKCFEELNCENIGSAVTLANKRAVEMYQKNGFEIKGKEEKEGILFID